MGRSPSCYVHGGLKQSSRQIRKTNDFMFIINTAVIFVFGLVIAGIVVLGMFSAREFTEREKKVAVNRD